MLDTLLKWYNGNVRSETEEPEEPTENQKKGKAKARKRRATWRLYSGRGAIDKELSSDAKAVLFVLIGVEENRPHEFQKYLPDMSPRSIAEACQEIHDRGHAHWDGDVEQTVETISELREREA